MLFSVGNFSSALVASATVESVSQLGSFHLLGPCVNRVVCFKLCQRGLVGSYHTLDRLAKVSVGGAGGGVSVGKWLAVARAQGGPGQGTLAQPGSGCLSRTRTDGEPSFGWESSVCKILNILFENTVG